MQVEAQQLDEAWVLKVRGEVDVFTAPVLDRELQAHLNEGNNVVVDMSEVTFLDSTGLGVLVKGLKSARTKGGYLRVVVTSPRVARPFEITGLDASIAIFDTVGAALAL